MYHLGKKRCSMMSGIVSQGLLKKDVYSIDGACPDVLGMSYSGTCAPQTITPNWLLNPALITSWLGPLTNNFLRTQEKSIFQINFFCLRIMAALQTFLTNTQGLAYRGRISFTQAMPLVNYTSMVIRSSIRI